MVDPYSGFKAQYGYHRDLTGLYYCTYRYYNPEAKRWLTRDPIGFAAGPNQYAYCGNNPVNNADPDGTNPILQWLANSPVGQRVSQWVGQQGVRVGQMVGQRIAPALQRGWGWVQQRAGTLGQWFQGSTRTSPQTQDFTAARAKIVEKMAYAFGKATGNKHNIDRTLGNLKQLKLVGFGDTPASREYLTEHFFGLMQNPNNILKITEQGRTVRESLLMGPKGGLKIESI